jgi:hypothetical protein
MRIPSDPTRGAAPNNQPERTRDAAQPKSNFEALTPTNSGVKFPEGYSSEDLKSTESLEALLQAAARDTVASSPVAASLPGSARQGLENFVANDPVLRGLLTRHFEQD